MRLRIYLDTSVFSAYRDADWPDRQAATREFWTRLPQFEVSTSELARRELRQTVDPGLRGQLESLLAKVTVCPVTEEMQELARRYVGAEIFTPPMFNDAIHVAAAVLTRQDVLLSWNFRHLVNRRRRAQVNEQNVLLGLPTIEVIAPPEL